MLRAYILKHSYTLTRASRRQVALYLLLLEERYGQPLERGLLWYLNQEVRRLLHAGLQAVQ